MLPPELIDAIFSYLDLPSLEACSSAHPVFSFLVEPYIYTSVTVQISIWRNDILHRPNFYAHELLALLSEKPHISKYIRSFKITLWLSLTLGTIGMVSLDLNAISTIFRLLPSLRSLSLFSSKNLDETLWNELPGSFQTALVACLHLPSMKEVDLCNIVSFPLTILDDLPNIKNISLGNMRDLRYSTRPGIPGRHSLQVLSVYGCGKQDFDQIILWAKSRQLHSLRVNPNKLLDMSRIAPLLQISNSLTTLEIDFCNRSQFQIPFPIHATRQLLGPAPNLIPLNLADFTQIQRVVFRMDASYNRGVEPFKPSFVWSLPAISKFFCFSLSLKHITLHIHFYFYGSQSLPELDWSPLNRCLSLSNALQHIDLHVAATWVHSTNPISKQKLPPATLISSLSQNKTLRSLMEKGLVTIGPDESDD